LVVVEKLLEFAKLLVIWMCGSMGDYGFAVGNGKEYFVGMCKR
jgi:hypothetical protein